MINSETTIEQLGAIVCQALRDVGIDAFLSGGAVVSIYSNNQFESLDLDFVSFGGRRKIKAVMEKLGFLQDKSRLFRHPHSVYMVGFPGTALVIGDEPIREFAERVVEGKTLKLLTPTDCVKDRLAAYIHGGDRQGLEQAALVASQHACNFAQVEKFCKTEGATSAFQELEARLMAIKSK